MTGQVVKKFEELLNQPEKSRSGNHAWC